MAETLTYDNTPDAEVLTPDEQDSLQIGEQLEEEQEQLLAGKYENAEELERAYIELQRKLGDSDEGDEEEVYEDDGEVYEETETEYTEAQTLISNASQEYAETGQISDEMFEQFGEMSSQDLVEAYMNIQANAPEAVAEELSESEVNSIKNSVGGDQAYDNVMQWAGENLDPTQIDAFDDVIANGNSVAIQMMVNGLKAQYDSTNGYEGRMLSGKSANAGSSDVFRSQAELVAAMGDSRYESDPAYRNDLLEKLDRSDLNF
ncbi:MAG: hypothetical protein CML42_10065 [Rhodobacteraceae bacterium]|nr:hypothetical protein [Paracoccaceae bacterium]|tara:strand:+ start:80 stop:862 length:783 start_codon:yes stop_codon:yes gene_type:complete